MVVPKVCTTSGAVRCGGQAAPTTARGQAHAAKVNSAQTPAGLTQGLTPPVLDLASTRSMAASSSCFCRCAQRQMSSWLLLVCRVVAVGGGWQMAVDGGCQGSGDGSAMAYL